MRKEIGVSVTRGLDVPKFLEDVPMVAKFVSGWGTIPPNISQESLKEHMDHEKRDRGLVSLRIGCTKFS